MLHNTVLEFCSMLQSKPGFSGHKVHCVYMAGIVCEKHSYELIFEHV